MMLFHVTVAEFKQAKPLRMIHVLKGLSLLLSQKLSVMSMIVTASRYATERNIPVASTLEMSQGSAHSIVIEDLSA